MASTITIDMMTIIVEHVAEGGFRNLAPLILAGKGGLSLVETPTVLHKANLDEMYGNGEMVRCDSPFRPFFKKSIAAGNKTALALEGLRKAFVEVEVLAGIEMVRQGDMGKSETMYALGMLHICSRDFSEGYKTLKKLKWWDNMATTIVVADLVHLTIVGMSPRRSGAFAWLIEFSIPGCTCEPEEMGKCPKCYVIWVYSNYLKMCMHVDGLLVVKGCMTEL